MSMQTIDQGKAEAFAGQVLQIENNGMLTLLIGIGHQAGLFDRMAELPPSTSRQIADIAGLHERYVREWLAGMVVGRIIEYDPVHKTYTLPAEHAASLTRTAGPGNLAGLAPFVARFGVLEPDILNCFRHGGGISYIHHGEVQQLQDELGHSIYDATLITTTLPLASGLVEQLRAGIDVLEVGCGSGHALNLMAQAFPRSRFTGYDLMAQRLQRARAESERLGVDNVHFAHQNILMLDGAAHYDLVIAFDVVHDLADPVQGLQGIAAALKPDGRLLMAEIAASSNLEDNLDHPLAPALYTVSLFHCTTVSLAEDGLGVGAMWGEQQVQAALSEAGFTQVEVIQVPGDFQNNYYLARKSP